MLVKFKNEKMEICKKSGKKWNESDYVFLNTEGTPYVPEKLTNKITKFIKKIWIRTHDSIWLKTFFCNFNE